MRKSQSRTEIEKLFLTTCEEILIALLEGEMQNSILAKRVGITQQHLSRLLPKLQESGLIISKFPNVRRINSLTSKGKIIAKLALQKKSCVSRFSLHSQPKKHNGNNHMVRHNNRRNSRTKLLQRKRIWLVDLLSFDKPFAFLKF